MNSGVAYRVFGGEAGLVATSVAGLVFCLLRVFGQTIFRSPDDERYPVLESLATRSAASGASAKRHPLIAGRWRRVSLGCGLAVLLAPIGFYLAGPVGGVVAGAVGASLPYAVERRRSRKQRERLEVQFAEYVEALAMAVRGGLSIPQAMELAGEEAEEPLRRELHQVLSHRRFGWSLDRVLDELTEAVPTNETRLLTLVLRLHAKSGGNLAASLDDVATAIRDRTAARRDLHALSAQGRMSGAILASLPIAFFLVLAASARSDMSPVFHSSAGIVLIGSGLTLQALGYAWIRRLLRVRV